MCRSGKPGLAERGQQALELGLLGLLVGELFAGTLEHRGGRLVGERLVVQARLGPGDMLGDGLEFLFQADFLRRRLPFYVDPVDVPSPAFPLYFFSWKEVEHTHSRTHNNVYLNELKPETRLYINPADATPLGLEEGDPCWVESPYGQVRAKAHVTKRILAGCVGFFRGHGHWGLGKVAKGKGSHDGWLLPGRAEIHSGQAVHKEVGCRVYKAR